MPLKQLSIIKLFFLSTLISCQYNFEENNQTISSNPIVGRYEVKLNQNILRYGEVTTLQVYSMLEESVLEEFNSKNARFFVFDTTTAYLIPSDEPNKKYLYGNNIGKDSVYVYVPTEISTVIVYPAFDTTIVFEVVE